MANSSQRSIPPIASVSGVTEDAGETTAVIGSAHEKRAHGAVSDGLYRLLVESVNDYAIFALDPDGYILSWNLGAQRLKGYTASEIIGSHFSVFYPQERNDEKFPEYELEMARRDGRFEDEGWRIRKDGSRLWANVIITALRDESGSLVGFAKVTRDLTERKAAEERLRASEERFRLLVTAVRDYGIFMLDPTGHVISWNEGAQHIKGYRADEIIGRHFSIFYPAERVAEGFPEMELREAARTGHFEDEGWRLRKDGTRFWANVVITALRDDDFRLIGFSKVTRDLTERKAAEEQRLTDARRVTAAEAANKAKSEFLATMSHELRTPLNAVGGYAELLSEGVYGQLSLPQLDALERIKQSQKHLLTVVSDLLNYSSIEGGRIALEITDVPVSAMIDSVLRMIEPQALAKSIGIERVHCPPHIVAQVDRARTEQVILNLLSNAVKFTPSGGHVYLTCVSQAGRVVITVADTGPGIPADKLEAIFEPFVQLGRALDSPLEGIGLGLAISRDLARQMGGDLVAASDDTGATFTLTLPSS